MIRELGRFTAALMVLAAGAVLAPACADNESTLFVRAVIAPSEDTCIVSADPGGTFLMGGVLDAALGGEYNAALLVGNQLVPRGNPDQLRTETSRIQLYAADVEVLDAGGAAMTTFQAPTSGFVDVGTGDEPGYGSAGVLMIDAQTAGSLGAAITGSGLEQQVVVSVILRGRTLGGNEVESAEFRYPVTVCYGCLGRPTTGSDPAGPQPNCDAAEEVTCPCRIGQDAPYDCCCAGVAACGP
jgi:hypothetical protein